MCRQMQAFPDLLIAPLFTALQLLFITLQHAWWLFLLTCYLSTSGSMSPRRINSILCHVGTRNKEPCLCLLEKVPLLPPLMKCELASKSRQLKESRSLCRIQFKNLTDQPPKSLKHQHCVTQTLKNPIMCYSITKHMA